MPVSFLLTYLNLQGNLLGDVIRIDSLDYFTHGSFQSREEYFNMPFLAIALDPLFLVDALPLGNLAVFDPDILNMTFESYGLSMNIFMLL
jgi:hypothetical protein